MYPSSSPPYAGQNGSAHAASPGAYPAVPALHQHQDQHPHQDQQQHHQQQQQQQAPYPAVKPLAEPHHQHSGAAGAPPLHAHSAPAYPYPPGSPHVQPQQPQMQLPYPSLSPAGAGIAGLSDDLHSKLHLQHAGTWPHAGSHPQQQQPPQPQSQQPYPCMVPLTHQQPQQQQQPGSPLPVPGTSPRYPSLAGTSPQQQQQQQQTGSGCYPRLDGPGASSSGGGGYEACGSFGSTTSANGAGAGAATTVSRYPSVTSGGSSSCFAQPPALQQQQREQEQQTAPLPPYPPVPKALPVQPYTVAPEKAPQGYDLMLHIRQAANLPACDWWNGLADPYVIITAHVGGAQISYRTAHKRRTINPTFEDEFFQLGNLPPGSTFFVEVWDKDMVTDDDVIGRATWSFSPKEMQAVSSAGGGLLAGDDSWGNMLVKLPLRHPSKAKKGAGEIQLEITYRPSRSDQPARMLGPCRFRQHLSPTAGVLTGHWWSNADSMPFSTYKLFLCNIDAIFAGVRMPWNRDYAKAAQIFKNPVVLATVRTQHSALYSTTMSTNRGGCLSSAADLFALFKNGMRDGQRRFMTYTLCEDSFRCSETGAAFLNDIMSKHAMHSGGQEEVLYAGEFCIVPCPEAAGGHKLVIDNNSGTYAPQKSKLPLMQKLFAANFPDLTVEVVAVGDPKLDYYHSCCPSRVGPA